MLGYPKVALLDSANQPLPLVIEDSGDQEVTSARPSRVDISPGSVAYVTVNKYRCDTGIVGQATSVRLTPPANTQYLQMSILENVPMDYCGPGDPGSILHVSPVASTYLATTPFQAS
jgi:hypothetical protein